MKQAKDFAKQEDTKNTFELNPAAGDKIVLNISGGAAAADGGFINLRKTKRPLYYKVTGNKIVDFFNKVNAWLLDNSKIGLKDKATFFNLLAVMLNAGLPLVRSLDSLSAQMKKNLRFSRIIYELARTVEHGGNLSRAMASYGDVFDSPEIGIVEAGEASGQLNQVLKYLGESAEKAHVIQSKVKGALLYPAFILGLLVVVVGVMFVYVIPKIKEFFANSGSELPTLTKVVIAISDFLVAQWKLISLLTLLAVLGFLMWKKTDKGKRVMDGIKLKFPIFGKILQKMFLARFARNFSNLLASGVKIISSLEISAHAVGNEIYKEKILMSAEDLKQGIPLGESMKDNPLFPLMLVNIVEVGEQTAQLDKVTGKLAKFYDDDIQNTINSISKVIEPVLLVSIGLTIGIIVMAIMLPIIKLTDLSGAGL